MGGFNILQFRRHTGAGSDREASVVDRFDLLRQAVGSVVRLGLNDTVAVDALRLTQMHKLDACFVNAIMALRARVRNTYWIFGE